MLIFIFCSGWYKFRGSAVFFKVIHLLDIAPSITIIMLNISNANFYCKKIAFNSWNLLNFKSFRIEVSRIEFIYFVIYFFGKRLGDIFYLNSNICNELMIVIQLISFFKEKCIKWYLSYIFWYLFFAAVCPAASL